MKVITLKEYARVSFVEKKSEFISTASPVFTDEEAQKFVLAVKKEFPDARHNVYAYIVAENNITRFSDDGEPKGTAGLPVLEVLKKNNLVNCAVVVTRYFGGILLGTGGLTRAYTKGAADAVEASKIVTLTEMIEFSVTCDFSVSEKVRFITSKAKVICDGTDYTDVVTFKFAAVQNEYERLRDEIIESTSARARIEEIGYRIAPEI